MATTVSITNQGQISIPIKIRRSYGLNKFKKALVYPIGKGKIVIEPIKDLLLLEGSLKTAKKISSKKARREFEKYLATRHLK